MADIEEILGLARLPEKTFRLCLRPDLVADWEELERKLQHAQKHGSSDSLAGSGGESRAIAEQMAKLENEMAEHTAVFRLRALGRKAWADVVAKYPPTEEQRKEREDLDWESAAPEILASSAVDPAMDEEQAGRLIDLITQAQWMRLAVTLLELNRGEVSIPFSPAASAIRSSSASK